jgi:hypothetical protein
MFLLSESGRLGTLDTLATVRCTALFAANHRYSLRYNLERDLARKPNIGTIVFFPRARVIPMHLTIILAANFAGHSIVSLPLFLGLKTAADVLMHVIEHREPRGTKARRAF